MALKLQNKGWYPVIFLVAAAVVIALFHPATGNRPEFLLSLILAAGGFVHFLYRQHLDETKLFKELFVEFNERYKQLNEGLNKIYYGPKEGLLSEAERNLLFSYFNLCAEEYLFYKAGYLDAEVWESWSKGMDLFLNHPRVGPLWETEKNSGSYYGFPDE